MRKRTALLATLVLTGLLVSGPPDVANAEPTCAGTSTGGDWPLYGRDLANTRSQPDETVIDATAAADLGVGWTFTTSSAGSGAIQSTPVVTDGCVYFGTSTGWVFALNADDGVVVWKTKLSVGSPGLLCTGIVGSTPAEDGRVFAAVSQAGSPYVAALDQTDGALLWQDTVDTTDGVYNCASPVPFNGMVIGAFNGDQTGECNRGGYVIYDAATGDRLAFRYTAEADPDAECRGGGIWSTAAVDPATGYAFAGTSNPDAGTSQHELTDALIKIDVAKARDAAGAPTTSTSITNPDFGAVVDHYAGTPDRYLPLPDPPTCTSDPSIDVYVRSVMCAQMDLDFGASPQLFDGPDGLFIGDLQKSGVYHAADAATMGDAAKWETVVGPPFFYANGSSPATDGESIFVAGSPPGQMFSLDADTGLYEWASPIADALHYQGVAHANGLVYTTDVKGFLDIYDAETGMIVAHRPMHLDVGEFLAPTNASSASASIARNTVYAAAGQHLVAYVP